MKKTLVIDIGGTGTKMLVVDDDGAPLSDRDRERTPRPATPETVLGVIRPMVARQPPFDRVSVGFPGLVRRGVVETAPNLSTPAWAGFDLGHALRAMINQPVGVLNDADLQGYGVIEGFGVEMVITLGTGLGTALFTDGKLVPNVEFGHHPWDSTRSYEDHVGQDARDEIGRKLWRARVRDVFARLQQTFSLDHLWVGGGNAKALKPRDLPEGVTRFSNVEGMAGGARLWELESD
jgi:polyphosphate glucokinase